MVAASGAAVPPMDPHEYCAELVNRVAESTKDHALTEAIRRAPPLGDPVACSDPGIRADLRFFFPDEALDRALDDAGEEPLQDALPSTSDYLLLVVYKLLEPLYTGTRPDLPEYHVLSPPRVPCHHLR